MSRGKWISECRQPRQLVVVCTLLVLVEACGGPQRPLEPLNDVRAVRRLSSDELQLGRAVLLTGVVTIPDNEWGFFVMQGATGGIPVARRTHEPRLHQGDRVEVRGYTAWEGRAPIVVNPTVRVLAAGTPPGPAPADASLLFAGGQDFEWVRMEGVVRRTEGAWEEVRLELDMGGRSIEASGRRTTARPLPTLDVLVVGARVRLTGTPLTLYTPSGEVRSHHFLLAEEHGIELLDDASTSWPGVAPPPAEGAALTRLDKIADVKALSMAEAERGHPVLLRGVYVFVLGNRYLFDGRFGIYVEPPVPRNRELALGKEVEVEGVTGAGAFAPIILRPRFRVLRQRVPLVPVRIDLSTESPFQAENAWVQVDGVVQAVVATTPRPALQLGVGHRRLTVLLGGEATPDRLERLVDAQIRVRGVFAPLYTADRRSSGFSLLCPSLELVDVVGPPAGDTFDSSPRPIHQLLEFDPQGYPRHRIKVAGTLTYAGGEDTYYVEDDTAALRVSVLHPSSTPVGASVEAIGFLRDPAVQPALDAAEVRLRPGLAPRSISPLPVEAQSLDRAEGRLVSIEGFLVQRQFSMGRQILQLATGRHTVTAWLDDSRPLSDAERLREGALVRVTGVCQGAWDRNQTPAVAESFTILLRSPADVLLLRAAPWLTTRRAVLAAGSLLGTLLLAAGWVLILRRQVGARTAQLRERMARQEALETRLRQTQKLESLGRLAGGVAHDFNNLLVVINGYSDLLLREVASDRSLAEPLEQIGKAGQRAADLTRQLLAFSRQQVLSPVILDLNGLIADVERMLRRLIGEDIQLEVRPCREPALVRADPGQLDQVLVNLAANARDAMPEGGRLTIEVERLTLEARDAAILPSVTAGAYACISVTDTGTGMDEQTRARIFEPFFTTKELGRGTGLGLATVFGIVRQSGGHIWVYSEPGEGTCFKVYLPEAGPEGPAPRVLETRGTSRSGTILVVEDHPEVQRLVLQALAGEGHRVLAAASGEEALVRARQHPEGIDLLLTDVVLPGMNGRALAEALRVERPGIRVLYISGYTADVITHKGILEADVDYLAKPFTATVLAARVRQALSRGTV